MKLFNSLGMRNVLTGGVLILLIFGVFLKCSESCVYIYYPGSSGCEVGQYQEFQETLIQCGDGFVRYNHLVETQGLCVIGEIDLETGERHVTSLDATKVSDYWTQVELNSDVECYNGGHTYQALYKQRYSCFVGKPWTPGEGCGELQCPENYAQDGCTCVCTGPKEINDCNYMSNACEYEDYQFEVDKRVEVDCEERDSHGRPLVKLKLQERKWRPGWLDSEYRSDNDISSCMSNQVMGKAIEVWEYGDCGVGDPMPDIYRGTFRYPDQMEMYLGRGKCDYYLNVNWDDPDLWWFTPISFSVECLGDCILQGPSEEEGPPLE